MNGQLNLLYARLQETLDIQETTKTSTTTARPFFRGAVVPSLDCDLLAQLLLSFIVHGLLPSSTEEELEEKKSKQLLLFSC